MRKPRAGREADRAAFTAGALVLAGILASMSWAVVSLLRPSGFPASRWPASTSVSPSPVPSPRLEGKRVVALSPIQNVQIELPDLSVYDFGEDFLAALTSRLVQSGRYLVVDARDGAATLPRPAPETLRPRDPPPISWLSSFVPAASVKIRVDTLAFQAGFRGGRMFYGFDDRFRTPFNDGLGTLPNEYPLRSVSFEPNWFDRTFDEQGSGVLGSRSGLDLGEGFRLDAIYAWVALKYASYRSRLGLSLQVDAPLSVGTQTRLLKIRGQGYYFDIVGGYAGYSAGISIARRDAMTLAMRNALNGAFATIEGSLAGLPLTARVDGVLADADHTILLGTGIGADVLPGVVYQGVSAPEIKIRVKQSVPSGALGLLVSGSPSALKPGLIVREILAESPVGPSAALAQAREKVAPPEAIVGGLQDASDKPLDPAAFIQIMKSGIAEPGEDPRVIALLAQSAVAAGAGRAARPALPPGMGVQRFSAKGGGAPIAASTLTTATPELIELPWTNLPKSDLSGKLPSVSVWQAIAQSLVDTSFIVYRIWRYLQYDQAYQFSSDTTGEAAAPPVTGAPTPTLGVINSGSPGSPESPESWAASALQQPWAQQIGLAHAPPMMDLGARAPVIAFIDSGLDYNHSILHDRMWLNPFPSTDSSDQTDLYGWDFISGDSRPYDDQAHGTETASALVAVAPYSRLMAVKAFNPWGITTSAALYGSFVYAVDHGAQIIVCAWATRLASRALEQGVAYARDHGVLVVTAAGDRGDDLSEVAAFPAVLAPSYPNLLAVAGVDTIDGLIEVPEHFSNFGRKAVELAAPGLNIATAEPRLRLGHRTSTSQAAAIVAGAAARLWAAQVAASPGGLPPSGSSLKSALLDSADRVPSLLSSVRDGKRLKVLK